MRRGVLTGIALVLAAYVLAGAQQSITYPPLLFRDEGSDQGRATRAVDCTGTGVTCSAAAGVVTLNVTSGGGGAPTDATYITQTADGTLTNEQALSSLSTGYMKVTTGTGVVSSQATPIPVADGGTALSALGTAYQYMRVNSGETALEYTDGPIVLVLGADVSTAANTNLVDITGMTFTAAAATTYRVNFYGSTQAAAATTGFGIGINCAQTPVLVALTGTTQLANSGTNTSFSAIANNAIVGVTSGRPSTNTTTPHQGGGVIRSHATTAGSCTFRLRSEVAAVVTIKQYSTFIVQKVE